MDADEADDALLVLAPDLIDFVAGRKVQSGEGFIKEQDLGTVMKSPRLGDDQSDFLAISLGEFSVGFIRIELDSLGHFHGKLALAVFEKRGKDLPGFQFRVKSKVLVDELDCALAANGSLKRRDDAGNGLQESGLSTAVSGEKEMAAISEFDRTFGRG